MEAVGVVTDLVVVRVSKIKAAYESLEESGVDEKDRNDDSRCERMVVLPDPLSPLDFHVSSVSQGFLLESSLTRTQPPGSPRAIPIE